MISLNPYLNFGGNTEEAFTFYKSVFGGEFVEVMRLKDFEEMGELAQLPEEDLDKIGHIALALGEESLLMGADALESLGQSLTVGNNFSLALEAESAEEAERLFDALSSGGQVEMPLQETEWAETFGMCVDKYGVKWSINYTGDAAPS